MGTCVSHIKDPKSTMRFKEGEDGKEKKVDCERKVMDSGSGASDLSSKDEIFFDSKPWIDSDCEDDFYSVKGDFTPSRGSTPLHPSSIPGTPRLSKTFIDVFPVIPSEPSPRKKLAQLLLETSADDKVGDAKAMDEKVENKATCDTPTGSSGHLSKSFNGTPRFSDKKEVNSISTTPKGGLKNGRMKNDKAMECCLPSVQGFVSYEWKKLRASPKHHPSAVCA